MMRSSVRFTALAAIAIAAGGCLVMKGSSVDESGVRISQATLQQIQPGQTTEAWVIATLGEPTARRSVDEHTSILRYEHTVATAKGGAVFLLFAGGEAQCETTATILEITDGVVTRYWQEGIVTPSHGDSATATPTS